MLTTDILPGVPLIESPFFSHDLGSLPPDYRPIARQLHDRGYAILDFPDATLDRKIGEIRERLSDKFGWADPAACPISARIQDAWKFDPNVRAIACNQQIIDMLSALYCRPAFPFQTLNFPVGTQQPGHSDHIHFSSIPERFMCGVWLAFEDVDEDNGPLFYYPGSHAWPSFQTEHLGVTYKRDSFDVAAMRFTQLYQALADGLDVKPEVFLARKGQALIWTSNLVHGGSRQTDPARSRWSQVTHYFFEGCGYTTPILNDTFHGRTKFRKIVDIRNGRTIPNVISGVRRPRMKWGIA